MTLLALAIDFYSFVVFVAVLLSWFNLPPDNSVVRLTSQLTEPVLGRIRRVLPAMGGFDLSPMILLLGLRLLRGLVLRG